MCLSLTLSAQQCAERVTIVSFLCVCVCVCVCVGVCVCLSITSTLDQELLECDLNNVRQNSIDYISHFYSSHNSLNLRVVAHPAHAIQPLVAKAVSC